MLRVGGRRYSSKSTWERAFRSSFIIQPDSRVNQGPLGLE